jgi:hypothetical protein
VSPSNNLGKVTTRCRVGGLSIASHVMGSQALGMERRIEYTRAVTSWVAAQDSLVITLSSYLRLNL